MSLWIKHFRIDWSLEAAGNNSCTSVEKVRHEPTPKPIRKRAWSFHYRKFTATDFRAFLKRWRTMAKHLLSCCAIARGTDHHSASPKTALQMKHQIQPVGHCQKASPLTTAQFLPAYLYGAEKTWQTSETLHPKLPEVTTSPLKPRNITLCYFSYLGDIKNMNKNNPVQQ